MINYSELKEKQSYAFNYVIPALVEQNYISKAEHIASCGHWKEIAHCQDCGTNYLSSFNTCKERFCPICELKRSRLWFTKMVPVVEELLDCNYYLNMVTLTIPDTESLKEGLKLLFDTWRYLLHDDKISSKEFKKRFIGGIRCLEIKKGANSGKWHCHFHCIVAKSEFSRDIDFLINAWSKAYSVVSKNKTDLNVDIRPFKYKNRNDLLKNVLECCKYVSKFEWHIDKDVAELLDSMKGIRSVSTWGLIKAMIKEDSIEYLMDKSLSEVDNLVCSVCGSSKFDFLEGPAVQKLSIRDFDKEQLDNIKVEDMLNGKERYCKIAKNKK